MSQAFTVSLTAVTSTGNITQIYPPEVTAGDGTGAFGTQKRSPCEGWLYHAEVQPDGTNGGTLELWDLNGADAGADVDTLAVVTNTQKNTLAAQTPPAAKLIHTQTVAGSASGENRVIFHSENGVRINRGLAARFVGAAGTCVVNFRTDQGFKKVWIAGV